MTYSEQTDSVYTSPLNIYRALLYTLYNDDRGEAGISELCRRRTSVIKVRETTTMPLHLRVSARLRNMQRFGKDHGGHICLTMRGHQPILEHANRGPQSTYDRYDSNLDNEIHYQPEKVG